MTELEILKHAMNIIHGWHGDLVWDIYYRSSPEMRPIRKRIDELEAQQKVSADQKQLCPFVAETTGR